jgi:hypothetical protein
LTFQSIMTPILLILWCCSHNNKTNLSYTFSNSRYQAHHC